MAPQSLADGLPPPHDSPTMRICRCNRTETRGSARVRLASSSGRERASSAHIEADSTPKVKASGLDVASRGERAKKSASPRLTDPQSGIITTTMRWSWLLIRRGSAGSRPASSAHDGATTTITAKGRVKRVRNSRAVVRPGDVSWAVKPAIAIPNPPSTQQRKRARTRLLKLRRTRFLACCARTRAASAASRHAALCESSGSATDREEATERWTLCPSVAAAARCRERLVRLTRQQIAGVVRQRQAVAVPNEAR
mmetsp:Transcript_15309/g.43937  ORF Transcript_15309/g.43937 Transcript_15309/m.43937 type:complete len:254 (+) Transcript_15309:1492-2253(+)